MEPSNKLTSLLHLILIVKLAKILCVSHLSPFSQLTCAMQSSGRFKLSVVLTYRRRRVKGRNGIENLVGDHSDVAEKRISKERGKEIRVTND